MRKKIRLLACLSVLILTAGCAGAPVEKPRVSKNQGFADTNKIIDPDRLKKGGNLLIIPFTAGPGVEATEELDKTALMMVRGISEALAAGSSSFNILTTENADTADVIIKGHVVQMTKTGGIKKWVPGMKKWTLKVSGEMVERAGTNRVLVFSKQQMIKENQEDFKALGYALGQEIGRFIAGGGE